MAAACIVVAWLLPQLHATVFPIFVAPPWMLKGVTLLLAPGFPIAVLLARACELTPQGIVRTNVNHRGTDAGEAKVAGQSR